MKTLLVTGGAGFIGGCFVRRLADREDVRLINLDKLTYAGNPKSLPVSDSHELVIGDIGDPVLVRDLLQQRQPDAIVNFAAESHVDRSIDGPMEFVETNVVGTCRLLDEAKAYWNSLNGKASEQFRFLHVSTDEVYGSLGSTGLFTETTPYAPNSPYSASKAASDHFVRAWHHTYGLPVVISNCSNNYGAYQFPEKLIPLMIRNIRDERPLPVYGEGINVRDWLWVEDHASAIDVILHTGKDGRTYNIGGLNEWKNIDLVHELIRLVDAALGRPEGHSKKLITFVKDRAGHDLRYAIDASRIESELGWKPSITFEDGLAATVDWYLSNGEWLDSVTSGAYQQYYDTMYGNRG